VAYRASMPSQLPPAPELAPELAPRIVNAGKACLTRGPDLSNQSRSSATVTGPTDHNQRP